MSSSKIMIVEDNTTVAEDCRNCLVNFGHNITSVVASGEESIRKAGEDQPDAVLMDIRLRGEMDGIDAAAQIYSLFKIPVVFLSAYSDRELLKRAKQAGSFGYLLKPFEARELHTTLETVIFKDKTEKEQGKMEAQLRHAQKTESLRVMAGSIAHNFNNMLHSALGFTELGLQALPPESNARSSFETAKESINQAAKMSSLMLVYVGQGQSAGEYHSPISR